MVFHGATVQSSRLFRRANRAIARRVDATFEADKAIKHQATLPGMDLRRYYYLGKQSDSFGIEPGPARLETLTAWPCHAYPR